MFFHSKSTTIFIPDGREIEIALPRTTHMAISAHQDDIEMMAAQPIIECFDQEDLWFSGIVMTDGRGSPRTGEFESLTDDEMSVVRTQEQIKAATIGKYSVQIVLGYASPMVKDGELKEPVEDLVQILRMSRPQFVYTHNLADKHDTHVAVALRVLAAIRAISPTERPEKIYGCEVWRGLDWLLDEDQIRMDLSSQEELQLALLRVFDSQISGGKHYDLASMGRRRANATFSESHSTDISTGLSFAMDMSELITNQNLEPLEFVRRLQERFTQDIAERLRRLS